MTESSKPRVFLVEDHPLTLFGLQRYLEDRFEVVGSATEAPAAIEMILERRPDLVLLDVHFPGGGGPAVIEAVKKDDEVKFLAFTVSTSAEDVVRLFKAGVDGYVVKTTDGVALEEQIKLALGGRPVSRYVAGHLLSIDEVASTQSEIERLTPKSGRCHFDRAGLPLPGGGRGVGDEPEDPGDPHETRLREAGRRQSTRDDPDRFRDRVSPTRRLRLNRIGVDPDRPERSRQTLS